jgi:hypothetical protein
MKKIIIILSLLFSFSALSASWPANMYTVNSIFYVQFSSLKSYMNKVMSLYPHEMKGNRIDFYKSASTSKIPVLTVIVNNQIESNAIVETMLFYVQGKFRERLTIKRVGTNRANSFKSLINFKFSLDTSIESTSFRFSKMKISQRVVSISNGISSMYRPFGDNYTQINLIETQNESQLLSKLYYQCSSCDSKAMTAHMSIIPESYGNMSYFAKDSTDITTPKVFFQNVNGYLGGLYSSFNSIPTRLVSEFGFPKVN